MCDHHWTLLTTKELERRAGFGKFASWWVRGCAECKHIEAKYGDAFGWDPLNYRNRPVSSQSELNYWRSIAQFAGRQAYNKLSTE